MDIKDARLVQLRTEIDELQGKILLRRHELTNIESELSTIEPVQFADVALDPRNDIAIAVGSNGAIWTSNLSDNSWQRRSSGIEYDLYAVDFNSDGRIALAVAGNGTVLRSTDLGQTWTSHDIGINSDLHDVIFRHESSQNTAIILGSDNTVFISYNGGINWQEISFKITNRINAAAFLSGTTTVILVGNDGMIVISNDEGRTWHRYVIAAQNSDINAIATHGSDAVVAVGDNGTILVSTDGGEVWRPRGISGIMQDLRVVEIDSRGGGAIAVGNRGTVLTSIGNFRTWIRGSNATTRDLNAISIADGTGVAISVGKLGAVVVTTNSGISWDWLDSELSDELVAVAIGGQNAIIVGKNTAILQASIAENGIKQFVKLKEVKSGRKFENVLAEKRQHKVVLQRSLLELQMQEQNKKARVNRKHPPRTAGYVGLSLSAGCC